MTSPAPIARGSTVSRRANWLGRYLDVERSFDRQLYSDLKEATKGIDSVLVPLVGKKNISSQVRRLQLSLAHKEIRNRMDGLFGNVTGRIRHSQKAAATAAVDAALVDESSLIARLFPDPDERKGYAESLRLSAARNIDTVMTRVLFTQQPLSKRVYKTKALANGMVSRAINNGLASGASAADIARSVHHLVDPATPGGVSYAAKRLGRTEINNAFHAQAIKDAQDKPWIQQMRWYLTKEHRDDPGDACEDYARIGLFPVEKVPDKPHPQCRCYITPEPEDYDTFETNLIQGQYDPYLDEFLSSGSVPASSVKANGAIDMTPAPPEPSTTKAAQPKGWTGPLVAKSAANSEVRLATNEIWLDSRNDPGFLQAAREGSRTVQIKGYKGGLSSPGKQAILGYTGETPTQSLATDIGREMTARVAYAEPSTQTVWQAQKLSAIELNDITQGRVPGISMPLSTFETSATEAFDTLAHDGKYKEVLFKVEPGAKVADVGNKRVSMGNFEIGTVTDYGDHHVVSLRQIDPREFEANPIKGADIPDFEFVDKIPSGTTISTPTPPPTAPTIVTTAERIRKSVTVDEVRMAMRDKWPRLQFTNFDAKHTGLESAKETMETLDGLLERFPGAVDNLTHVEIWTSSQIKGAYAHIQPEWDGTAKMRLNSKYMQSYVEMFNSKRNGDKVGWTTNGAGEKPWYGTVTHEFGHVLDWVSTNFDSHDELVDVLKAAKKAEEGKTAAIDKPSMVQWLQGTNGTGSIYGKYNGAGPSGYAVSKAKSPSRSRNWGYNPHEIVAEAFIDTERNGSKAKRSSRAVHKWLMDKYSDWEDAHLTGSGP